MAKIEGKNLNIEKVRRWYASEGKNLPEWIGTEYMQMNDVRQSIQTDIAEINAHIERHGEARAYELPAVYAAFCRLRKTFKLIKNKPDEGARELKSEFWRLMAWKNQKPR